MRSPCAWACLALLAAASGASAASVPPAADRFAGTIVSGTGAYRHATGHMAIVVRLSSGATRVSLALTGRRCSAAPCVSLSGRLTGTAERLRRPPDAGAAATLSATGRLTAIGGVRAGGTLRGTGFIRNGRETLELTLRADRGTLHVSAHTAPVPGFSFPR
jgi:hypothetical protein